MFTLRKAAHQPNGGDLLHTSLIFSTKCQRLINVRGCKKYSGLKNVSSAVAMKIIWAERDFCVKVRKGGYFLPLQYVKEKRRLSAVECISLQIHLKEIAQRLSWRIVPPSSFS